jgi:hypothetical protein
VVNFTLPAEVIQSWASAVQIQGWLSNDSRGWLHRDFNFIPTFRSLLFAGPKSVVEVNRRFSGGDL